MTRLHWHGCRAVVAGVFFIAFASGCEGSGQGMSVRLSPAQRPDVTASAATGSLRVPDETPFNIRSFKSGQDGLSARGEANPAEGRGATCTAQVGGTGSAWAEFQLGYCFDNATGKPLQAIVKLSATVRESAEKAVGQSDSATASGNNGLTFLVKDTAGLVVRQESLAASDLSKGARSTTNRHEMVFDIQCEPDRGYYVLIAGRSSAEAAGDGSTANTRLDVTDISLQLEYQPGEATARPAQPAADSAATAGS
jgi:hypothetical protein